jgi:hypothetical protein
MRNILDVMKEITDKAPHLTEPLQKVRDEIEREDRYLAPELARHRWREVAVVLSKECPEGHKDYEAVKKIFTGV